MKSKDKKEVRNNSLRNALKKTVRFIFSPVIKVTDNVNKYYGDQTLLKKTLISAIKLHKLLVPGIVILLVFFGIFFWVQSDNTATMIMSLNYEESAKGLNPNGTRFNIYEVKSEDVIRQVLYYFGMDEKSVDIKSISDGITITPLNVKEFDSEDYYINTSYRIKLKKPDSIKDVTAKQMLTYLNKAFKDKFYSNYAENRSILSFDINQFDESEYNTIADLLSLKANQLSKYLNMRKKQSKTFAEETTGETFISMSEKINNFCDYDIAKYRSFVLESGLSHNKVHYVRTLDYKNLMNGIEYDKNMESYNVRYDGISIYDESMISIVMIPTIDYEHKNYYMSKTKTGMDSMASQADNFLETAQATAKKIEDNNDIIKKMNAGINAPTDIDKANKMIVDMQNKLASISNEIEIVDKEYIAHRTNNYITIKMDNSSLKDRLQIENLIIVFVAFVAVVFGGLWLVIKRRNRGDRQ